MYNLAQLTWFFLLTCPSFASLPKPKDIELEEPEEPLEDAGMEAGPQVVIDQEEIDRRMREKREAQHAAELKRRTQVLQKSLPRPSVVDIDALVKRANHEADAIRIMVSQEMATLIGSDALRYPIKGGKVTGSQRVFEKFDDGLLERARMEVLLELSEEAAKQAGSEFEEAWQNIHGAKRSVLPGLEEYGEDDVDRIQLMVQAFDVYISQPLFMQQQYKS